MTWYQNELWLLFMSRAGAHPKNDAREIPLYGDIRVRSALRTIFGYFGNLKLPI